MKKQLHMYPKHFHPQSTITTRLKRKLWQLYLPSKKKKKKFHKMLYGRHFTLIKYKSISNIGQANALSRLISSQVTTGGYSFCCCIRETRSCLSTCIYSQDTTGYTRNDLGSYNLRSIVTEIPTLSLH